MLRPTVFAIAFVIVIVIVFVLVFNRCSRPPDAAFYRQRGLRDLKRALEAPRFEGKAKNVIVFVGDGLGGHIYIDLNCDEDENQNTLLEIVISLQQRWVNN